MLHKHLQLTGVCDHLATLIFAGKVCVIVMLHKHLCSYRLYVTIILYKLLELRFMCDNPKVAGTCCRCTCLPLLFLSYRLELLKLA